MFEPRTLFILACSGKKTKGAAAAGHLYQGDLFKKSLAYARKQGAKEADIIILSAKHGVLRLGDVIAPYDMTLNNFSMRKRKAWNRTTAQQLRAYLYESEDTGDKVVCLAGAKYVAPVDLVANELTIGIEKPLQGLGIGKQLAWLTNELTGESK
ncbi:hypothetical protein tloyanaT_13270 [Thalassotalea loyana]|uniref:DUF6884 domain-containing protein n=1 Tax=Thalassotalea loyana TaxID=280483 RepID=A0ABQ6HEA3_9GAMM|nr:DUF6884 domain-containing protein [Thalassotalea loyana]GLX85075.1 hypothetical protein tloyanaT_13270 [Thalassotalea loyana]